MRTAGEPPAARPRVRSLRRAAAGVLLAVLAAPFVAHLTLGWLHGLGPLYAGLADARARAQELSRRAKDFDPEAALAALPPHAKNGFCHRFDDHLAGATVAGLAPGAAPRDGEPATAAPAAARPASQPLLSIGFDPGEAVTLVAEKGTARVEDGVLRTTFHPGNVLVTRGALDLDPERVGTIEIRIKHARGARMTLGWSSAGALENRQTISLLPVHGEFYDYRISTATLFQDTKWPFTPEQGAAPSARPAIQGLVLQVSDTPGDEVEIDSLKLWSKRARYGEATHGASHETIAKEMRRVVYANTPLALEFPLAAPAGPLWLETGLGVLEAGDPVTFTVSVEAEGERRELLSEVVSDPHAWSRFEVDVSAWAGRAATWRFEARSAGGNVAFWSNPTVRGPPREPLHVVVLIEDALRADRLSCAGYPKPTTPNLDALAEKGALFLACYSQETKTRMSMPSMMTSLYPSATGVWNFNEVLHERYLTLAEILRSQGFETASLTQNPNAGAGAGLHQGYSYLLEMDRTVARPEEVYQRAQQWLAERAGRNVFLYLHVIDPHSPYDPPPPYDAWGRAVPEDGTPVKRMDYFDPAWVERPTAERRIALYDGEVAHDDARFAEFAQWLEGTGMARDTLLVRSADHGEFLGEHGMWDHHTPGYRPVLHVPLLLAFPGRVPAGKRFEQPVQLLDVAPTVLELAGIDRAPFLLQGDSLVGLFDGSAVERFDRRVVVSDEVNDKKHKGDERPLASLFFRRLHLLNTHQFSFGRRWPPGQYLRTFDLDENPGELGKGNALAWDPLYKARVAALVRELQNANGDLWFAMTLGVSGQMDYDPEMVERLRSLGYL